MRLPMEGKLQRQFTIFLRDDFRKDKEEYDESGSNIILLFQ